MVEKTVPSPREEAVPRETTRAEEQYIAPPVDIFETEEQGLTLLADLPGVEPEGLDVRVEDDILTIQAKPKHLLPGEPYHQEYQLVNFFRQFQLSDEVDVARISAELKNGVLTLRLPKMEKAKPKRIQVKVG